MISPRTRDRLWEYFCAFIIVAGAFIGACFMNLDWGYVPG